jgi:hypothetical protein
VQRAPFISVACVRCAEVLEGNAHVTVSVPVYHYGVLKGYLAAHGAPTEVFAALEALYSASANPPFSADLHDTLQKIMEAADHLSAVKPQSLAPEQALEPEEIELPPLTRKMLEKANESTAPAAPAPSPKWEDPGEVEMVPFEQNPNLKSLPDGLTSSPTKKYGSLADHQIDEVRTLSETLTDEEIGHELGVSRDTVIRFRAKHDIGKEHGPREGKPRSQYQWETWQKQKLIEMKQAGASYGEIAKVVGKTPNQCSGMWFWEKKKLDTGAPSLSSPPDGQRPDSSPERLISSHNSYAGKRDPQPNPLQESDWPDIEQMLNRQRRSVSQLASDYEVDFDTMRAFIDEHQKPPPGEPQPSRPSVAVPAV